MSSSIRGFFRSRRYVLRDFEAIPEVEKLALRTSWTKVRDRPTEPPAHGRSVTWEVVEGTTLKLIQDADLRITYMAIFSNLSQEYADHLAHIFRGDLDLLSDLELLAETESYDSHESRSQKVVAAGIGAPRDTDDDFGAYFERAAQDPDPAVRTAAIRGICFAEWSRLIPVLRRMADTDQKRRVRKFADRGITAFTKSGITDSPHSDM